MYITYFGLREMPFSITPDPAYLYMSPRHQEALGHLLYGTGQYGGFVQLTGEVGTGKTTIVRTLLAQKLDDVDVAVILNPRQNEQEFVASICDELHVPYYKMPEKPATLKILVDALNAHLLDVHARGRRTVVIIDEAQNLQPEVLEQVRLLTNLETHKDKLLRITLVGQPELAGLLARPDLRQLAQRITARYHLTPLSSAETAEYVAHRLKVAGATAELFEPRAVQRIHEYARGIPRLVNILCDRALLGAYAAGVRKVTPEIAGRAAREVSGEPIDQRQARRVSMLDAVIVLAILGIGAWWFWREQGVNRPEQAVAAMEEFAPSPASVTELPSKTEAASAPARLDQLLRAAQPLPVGLSRLIQIWNAHPQLAAGENVCQALLREKLGCYRSAGEWRDLRALNRPAILTLSSGRAGVQHVLLRVLNANDALLETGQGPMTVALSQIDLLWTGEFLLLWRFETAQPFIGPETKGEAIAWLRRRLAEVENRTLATPLSETFDDELRQALLRFQTAQELDPDGLAGPRTLIALSNLKPMPGTPTLIVSETR